MKPDTPAYQSAPRNPRKQPSAPQIIEHVPTTDIPPGQTSPYMPTPNPYAPVPDMAQPSTVPPLTTPQPPASAAPPQGMPLPAPTVSPAPQSQSQRRPQVLPARGMGMGLGRADATRQNIQMPSMRVGPTAGRLLGNLQGAFRYGGR